MNESTVTATATPAPKTTTITLNGADGTTLQLVAERTGDTAKSYVLTMQGAKTLSRGMTEQHATFEDAKTAIAVLATKAEKSGWVRRQAGRVFTAKPDAFSKLPAAPKAVKAAK